MLIATGVSKRYGRLHPIEALKGVSLRIRAGDRVILIGANGAGKTTLLRTILGLTRPTSGSLLWETAATRHRIGYVPEKPLLPLRMTVAELFRLWHATPGEEFAQFGVADLLGRRTEHLSKGQAQRLSLALAFANDPPMVVLDEPFEGLDPLIRPAVRSFIAGAVARSGATLVVSTHRLEEIGPPFQRVLVMKQGRLTQDIEVSRIEELAKGQVIVLPADASSADLAEATAACDTPSLNRVRGLYGGVPAILVGPFPRNDRLPLPAEPLDVETLIQLWLQPEVA